MSHTAAGPAPHQIRYAPSPGRMPVRAVSACVLSLGLSMAPMALASEAARGQPLTVRVAHVTEGRIEQAIIAVGTVAAWREMPVSAEAEGLAIVDILADEGDTVRKGQVLARLNRGLLLALLDQNTAAVAEAEADLSLALADQQRAHALTSGVMSAQTIEQREALVRTRSAKLAAARAVLQETQVRLAQTEIRAPADAFVARRSASLGQVTQAGTELFRLIQDGRIEVNALVPEADLARVAPGQEVRIVAPSGGATTGAVRQVAPLVDERTRLGTVRVALPADTGLRPGMFVRVEIAAQAPLAVTVPLKALVWREGRPAVFAVSAGGFAELRPVTAGRASASAVEVIRGLAPGERIVVEGAGLLNEGEAVRAVPAVRPLAGMP